ncbi:MAG: histidine phosphatase family protein [Bacteroidales bacterium]|nr:histidine phosphatase family protein [Bacteroidales bacterium]
MKKIAAVALLLATFCTGIDAQSYREWLEGDISRAAYIYHNYDTFDTELGKAPAGFKPFYIPHYGRHGSRYHTSATFFDKCIPDLEKAGEAGLLTGEGQWLLKNLKELKGKHERLYGILTQVGSDQHQEVAARMYANFPQVFNQKDRREVLCISSPFPRCIQSMANFTVSLNSSAGKLRFHYYTGDLFFDVLACDVPDIGIPARASFVRDSLVNANFSPDRLMGVTFTDPAAAGALISSSPTELFLNVFNSAAISQNLEFDLEDMFPYFSFEELYSLSYAENCRMYGDWYTNAEFGDYKSAGTGKPILRDMLEKADAAVAGNDKAADLRFGHDSGLSPLMSFIKLQDNDWTGPIAEASDHWICSREMCMCSNLQLIFYRNRKGEVLVRILHNEREATITGLEPVTGSFYRWEDLRGYFVKILAD